MIAFMAEETRHKLLLLATTALLLVPLTLFGILVALVAYAAYPPPTMRPLQVGFDLAALSVAAATIATWRLVLGYFRLGPPALQRAHGVWFVLAALGALIGIPAAGIAVWHVLNPSRAPDYVGFALLAPAAVLAFLLAQLLWERRRTT